MPACAPPAVADQGTIVACCLLPARLPACLLLADEDEDEEDVDANVECQLRRGAAPVAMMKKRERRGSFDEDQESQKTLLSSSPAGRVESYTAHYYTVCCPPAPRGPLLLLHAHSTHTLLRVALTPPASYLVLHRTALRNIPPHYTHRYAAPLRCTTAALRCPHLRHLTNTPQPCLAAMKGAANSSAAHNPSVEPSSNSFFVPRAACLVRVRGVYRRRVACMEEV